MWYIYDQRPRRDEVVAVDIPGLARLKIPDWSTYPATVNALMVSTPLRVRRLRLPSLVTSSAGRRSVSDCHLHCIGWRETQRGRGGRRPLDGTIIVVPYRSRATHNRGRAECTKRGSGLQTRFGGILSTGPCSGRQCGHFEVAYVIFGRKNGFLANFGPSRPKIQPVPKVVLRPSARTLEVVEHDRL